MFHFQQTVDTSNIVDSRDVNNDSLSGTTDWVMINSEDGMILRSFIIISSFLSGLYQSYLFINPFCLLVPSSDERGTSNTYNVLKLKTFQKSHKE